MCIVTGTEAPNFVGTVAGISAGAIVNVHVSNGDGEQRRLVERGHDRRPRRTARPRRHHRAIQRQRGECDQHRHLQHDRRTGRACSSRREHRKFECDGRHHHGRDQHLRRRPGRAQRRHDHEFLLVEHRERPSPAPVRTTSAPPSAGWPASIPASSTGSHATGPVSGTTDVEAQYAVIVGGLVGLNNSPGQIVNSWSSSTVTARGRQVELGGLVGGNFGAITQSYATGSVSSTTRTPTAPSAGWSGSTASPTRPA